MLPQKIQTDHQTSISLLINISASIVVSGASDFSGLRRILGSHAGYDKLKMLT
ncbi:MAG: hypothetical protein HAW62_05135 [Endozoicomonadaceae bacterium]|nr:hypothetical protein [Endozoicomonadaceae bacterium]